MCGNSLLELSYKGNMDWLDKLILFFSCIVEIFLLYDYFNNFFEIKIKKKYVKIITLNAIAILFLLNLCLNATINLIFVPLLFWVFISLLFDSEIEVRLGYFVIAYIVMIGVEFLYIIISATTAEILSQTGIIPVSEYAWQLLFIKFLNYIVFLILKQTSSKSKKRMVNKLFIVYLLVPIASLGIMLTVFYSGIDINSHIILKIVLTIFFVCMLISNVLFFYVFQRYAENLSENARQQMEILYQKSEVERLTRIAELNQLHNETVHNITHYLKVIGQLAYENKNREIYNIVENINGKLNVNNKYEYSNHRLLNTLLADYYIRSCKNDINFDAYVEPGCRLDCIQDIHLVSMLGNMLDNAFAATTKKQEDASIVVRIFMQKNGRLCIIKVVNDIFEEVKIVRGKLLSTKKEKGVHGIGIESISKTANEYGGYFDFFIENNKFNAVLVLPIENIDIV